MFEDGSRYVVYSENTLYYLPSSSCSEGSSVTLNNTSVIRYRLINGTWLASDQYNTGSYGNTTYICHVYNKDSSIIHNPDVFVLPAVLIMLCFFSVIYHWFIRFKA